MKKLILKILIILISFNWLYLAFDSSFAQNQPRFVETLEKSVTSINKNIDAPEVAL
jgi:hypothetical protein